MWQTFTENPASRKAAFTAVNDHYLGHVTKLSETHEILAEDDIHDIHGMKLWAKGAPVSSALREKLLQRRLAQPLEATLGIKDGATMAAIVGDAKDLVATHEALKPFLDVRGAKSLLDEAIGLPLPNAVRVLLTAARENNPEGYRHSLSVMIASAGLAACLGLDSHDSGLLLEAALLHDVGELYISPEYLRSQTTLQPAEWKHVASHPCVGYALVKEFTKLPNSIAECILHHHERCDGSGYPFQIRRSSFSKLSAILPVADTTAAIILRGQAGMRKQVEVALHIIPGEYEPQAVAAAMQIIRASDAGTCGEPTDMCVKHITHVQQQLRTVREVASSMAASPGRVLASLGGYTLQIIENINKSLRSAGLADPEQLVSVSVDQVIAHEICLVMGEVSWRIRNLSRNLYLRLDGTGDPGDLEFAKGLIATLGETNSRC